MQVCPSPQTNNHTSTPPVIFFIDQKPFLVPNQQHQSTEGMKATICPTSIHSNTVTVKTVNSNNGNVTETKAAVKRTGVKVAVAVWSLKTRGSKVGTSQRPLKVGQWSKLQVLK